MKNILRPMPNIFFISIFLMASQLAWAFQVGTTRGPMTLLKDKPASQTLTIESLPAGTRISAGDLPVQGYYRVRTPSGKLGYILSGSLQFQSNQTKSSPPIPTSKTDYRFKARLWSALSSFPAADVNNLYEIAELKNGIGFGLEAVYPITGNLGIVGRIETLTKGLVLQVLTTSSTYNLFIKSTPVMLGVEFLPLHSSRFDLGMDALVGLGLKTQFLVTTTSSPPPNETQYGGSPLTFLMRTHLDVRLLGPLGLHAQLAYRLLKASQAPPTVLGAGAKSPGTAVAVDLSGIVLGGGLLFWF